MADPVRDTVFNANGHHDYPLPAMDSPPSANHNAAAPPVLRQEQIQAVARHPAGFRSDGAQPWSATQGSASIPRATEPAFTSPAFGVPKPHHIDGDGIHYVAMDNVHIEPAADGQPGVYRQPSQPSESHRLYAQAVARLVSAMKEDDPAGMEREMKIIHSHRGSLDFCMSNGLSPLQDAAARGKLSVLYLLLKYGAPVDGTRFHMMTALAHAVSAGKLGAVAVLIGSGADVNRCYANSSEVSFTALNLAASAGNTAMTRHLLEAGADVNARVATSPMNCAILGGHPQLVPILLEAGANPDDGGSNRPAPLLIAVGRGERAIVEQLIAAGADKTIGSLQHGYGCVLEPAIRKDNVAMLHCLYGLGVSLALAGPRGKVLLELAASEAKPATLDFLLEYGSGVEKTDADRLRNICLARQAASSAATISM